MWSSIGSLRESAQRKLSTVRESAFAAAQVAQDVLVTAATEDDGDVTASTEYEQWPAVHPTQSGVGDDTNGYSDNTNGTSSEQWPVIGEFPSNSLDQSFSASNTSQLAPPKDEALEKDNWPTPSDFPVNRCEANGGHDSATAVPLFPVDPTPEKSVLPPPPPPQPGDEGGTGSLSVKSERKSRYVVTGNQVATPVMTYPLPPRPIQSMEPASEVEGTDTEIKDYSPDLQLPKSNIDLTSELEKLRAESAANARRAENADYLSAELQRARAQIADYASKLERIDALSVQLEQTKAESAANARKAEKLDALSEELNSAVAEVSAKSSEAEKTGRELNSLTARLEEATAKSKALEKEIRIVREKFESAAAERDSLVHQRSVLSADSPNIPEALRTLVVESEAKTKEIAALQRQLKSSTAKVSKLTSHINTVKRQRDDAGARLQAAGEEFASLNSKLKKERASNAESISTIEELQSARDEALTMISDLTSAASKAQEYEAVIDILSSEKNELVIETETLNAHISTLTQQVTSSNSECSGLKEVVSDLRQEIQNKSSFIAQLETQNSDFSRKLDDTNSQVRRLEEELDSTQISLAEERSSAEALASEYERKYEDHEAASSLHIKSMWAILQNVLRADVLQSVTEDIDHGDSDYSPTVFSLKVLHGLRALSEEANRLREDAEDYGKKLDSSRGEIELMWRRIEATEKERDAANTERERWEHEASVARDRGYEEANEQAEIQVTNLLEQLEHTREDVAILQESLEKSETECSNVRNSLNQLSSKANETSRQLEDSEENVAYLQDEIATQKEDLDKLASELNASKEHANGLESQLLMLRDQKDKSENSYREIQLVMETHKTAEENLQIAIEQLEAEQETIIERKTVEIQKRLDDALRSLDGMKQQAEDGAAALNQLGLRDEEISELRGAIGRLSDERVELKLELENSYSRLNRPDGEQLVDRRVVRQLLVNYFRVGTARRRDVLELMSRMLGFSENDLVTVGLKRVNLSERLGSLLQPPELDDGNTLPPIGSVSDKWVSFLLKESTEEDDDF